MNKKVTSTNNKAAVVRPIDKYFEELNQTFGSLNKVLIALFLLLIFFGVMGVIWMIPFPQLQFLVDLKMHTFLNWGSFFIAIVIYLYLKLAPTLSYAMLFTISVMSFFIVQLEYVEKDGGPSVLLVCSLIAVIGFLGFFALAKKGIDVNGKKIVQLLTIGPVWLWSKVFEAIKLKY